MKKIMTIIASALFAALILAACGNTATVDPQEVVQEAASADDAPVDSSSSNPDGAEGISEKNGLSFGEFTTADFEGNEVTEDIFKDYDYTMVNFWGTYCGPCIMEMPEIAKIFDSLPENMQIVGIIIDLPYGSEATSTEDEAKEILDTTGVKYTNLLNWQGAYDLLSSISYAIPTTIFVDSEGNMVGEPIIGAEIDSYKERLAELSKLS